jgi:preprotein translocase subunit YajC
MGLLASGIMLIAQNQGPGGGEIARLVIPLAAIGVLFYFMLIRPQRRQENERRAMLGKLKKNDHVVTVGGIFGIVTNLRPEVDEVTIRVDESSGTKLRVTRSSIARVVSSESQGANAAGD